MLKLKFELGLAFNLTLRDLNNRSSNYAAILKAAPIAFLRMLFFFGKNGSSEPKLFHSLSGRLFIPKSA